MWARSNKWPSTRQVTGQALLRLSMHAHRRAAVLPRARTHGWGALAGAQAACGTAESALLAAVECISKSSVDPAVLRVCKQRERSAANDKLKKLEEENQRLKWMLGKGKQAGHQGGLDMKRKAAAEPERPAKKPEAVEPPAKKAKNRDSGSKTHKGNVKCDSNFMKMIREQGLDKDPPVSQGKGKGGSGSKSQWPASLEQDLREIEELKAKLGGNWRDELAQDGWLDLFDSMDSEYPFPHPQPCPPPGAPASPRWRLACTYPCVHTASAHNAHACHVCGADLGRNPCGEDFLGDSDEEHDSA